MDDLERLKVMLEHWLEHNREHVQTYKEWAERADAMGRKDIARVLSDISLESERVENLFIEALSMVKGKGQGIG